MTTMNQDRPHTRGHAFDDAGTCQHCGFDAAEWRWWRFNTTKGQKSQAMMPECEATNSTTESKR